MVRRTIVTLFGLEEAIGNCHKVLSRWLMNKEGCMVKNVVGETERQREEAVVVMVMIKTETETEDEAGMI